MMITNTSTAVTDELYGLPADERKLTHICPFYIKERRSQEKFVLNCEGGRLTFPDKESRRVLVYRCCAHPEGWKQCSVAQSLLDYYGRR